MGEPFYHGSKQVSDGKRSPRQVNACKVANSSGKDRKNLTGKKLPFRKRATFLYVGRRQHGDIGRLTKAAIASRASRIKRKAYVQSLENKVQRLKRKVCLLLLQDQMWTRTIGQLQKDVFDLRSYLADVIPESRNLLTIATIGHDDEE